MADQGDAGVVELPPTEDGGCNRSAGDGGGGDAALVRGNLEPIRPSSKVVVERIEHDVDVRKRRAAKRGDPQRGAVEQRRARRNGRAHARAERGHAELQEGVPRAAQRRTETVGKKWLASRLASGGLSDGEVRWGGG
jgi:hypothetical protein